MQVFRDFDPVSDDFVTLECVCKSDKFILLERKHKRVNESQAVDSGGIVFVQTSNVNYNCIVSFLEKDEYSVIGDEDEQVSEIVVKE